MASNFYDPSKGFEQNSDVSVEAATLARRQKLLEAMQARAMNPQITGPKGYAIGQLLANLGTSYILEKGEGKEKEKVRENEAARSASLSQNLGAYMDMRQGRAGDTMDAGQVQNLMQNDVAPQLNEPIQANPREAVIRAMASQHPELQAIGKMDMQAQLTGKKEKDFEDKIMPDGSVQRIFTSGEIKQLGSFAKKDAQWSEPYLMKGTDGKPLMVKKNLTTNEVDVVDKAPKITATANSSSSSIVPKGETEFSKALGKDVAEEYKQARQTAQQAYKAKSFVGQMEKLEQSGIFTGPTANIATTLGAVGQTLGIPVDTAKLANSQAFQQQFAAQVANVLTMGGGIGRSMTDADRKAFEQSLPTMLMSPQGRARVYQMINGQAEQDISRAKSFQENLNSNPVYKDSAGMLTLNPVDSSPIGLPGGVLPPGAKPVSGTPAGGAGPRVKNW